MTVTDLLSQSAQKLSPNLPCPDMNPNRMTYIPTNMKTVVSQNSASQPVLMAPVAPTRKTGLRQFATLIPFEDGNCCGNETEGKVQSIKNTQPLNSAKKDLENGSAQFLPPMNGYADVEPEIVKEPKKYQYSEMTQLSKECKASSIPEEQSRQEDQLKITLESDQILNHIRLRNDPVDRNISPVACPLKKSLQDEKGRVCYICGKQMTCTIVIAGGRMLHGSCFRCTICHSNLKNSGFNCVDDNLYCDIHAKQKDKTSSSKNELPKICSSLKIQQDPTAYDNEQKAPVSVNCDTKFKRNPYMSLNANCSPEYSSMKNIVSPVISEQSQGMVNNLKIPDIKETFSMNNGNVTEVEKLSDTLIETTVVFPPEPPKRSWNRLQQSNTHSNPPMNACHDSTTPLCKIINHQDNYEVSSRTVSPQLCDNQILSKGTEMPRITSDSIIPFVKVCEHCNTNIESKLRNGGFVDEYGKIFCNSCYEKYYAPKCNKCKRSIVKDCVDAMQKKWHPECFACAHCRQMISDSLFYLAQGKAYCKNGCHTHNVMNVPASATLNQEPMTLTAYSEHSNGMNYVQRNAWGASTRSRQVIIGWKPTPISALRIRTTKNGSPDTISESRSGGLTARLLFKSHFEVGQPKKLTVGAAEKQRRISGNTATFDTAISMLEDCVKF